MRATLVLPIAVLTLAGCNSQPSGPKTEEQVKQAVAEMEKPQPGQYKSTVKMNT